MASMCIFENRRDEVLVAYLYDDIEPAEREAFAAHLPSCPGCLAELDALSMVRADLATWAPPEPAAGVGGQTPRGGLRLAPASPPVAPAPAPRAIPVWMQAAAAVVFLAAALGAANLEVSYTPDGLFVRTGWLHDRSPAATADAAGSRTTAPTPWRADLSALEQQLRAEMSARPAADPAPDAAGDEALVRRVRALVAESEKRQQRELALRVAELAREAQVQRQADLVRIDRSLGIIQNRTGVEVMRTQQQLNSLAQRVSQRP